jgi:YggT family protein
MSSIITAIQIIFRVFSLIVIVDVLLSFLLPPFNPVKTFLDKIVEPFLNPIRKLIPSMGPFDFSPVILLIVLQLIEYLLLKIL